MQDTHNEINRSPAGTTALNLLLILLALLALVLLLASPHDGSAQEVAVPAATPDAGPGLDIFADRCANCHGPLGAGDGEMTAQLPAAPAAFNDPAVLRRLSPSQMFNTMTNGILDSGMPPFGPSSSNPIGEENRWNLVAAIYSLGTPQQSIEQGQAIYDASCLECHGEDGAGTETDLADQLYWVDRSNAAVFDTLAQTDAIPEHAYDLSEDELWNVVDFARTFSYEYADPLAAFAPIETAVVTGTVVNETTGALLPAGTQIKLNGFTADFQPSVEMTGTLDAEGAFRFDLTMVPPDLLYVATVNYEEISFGSDFGQLDRQDPELALPVVVYDKSTDPATVTVDQLHVILEFSADQVQVNELYQFSQNAPTVFVGRTEGADNGTVEIDLPDGATPAGFDRTFGSMDSFMPTDSVFETEAGTWADTVPLRPGQGTLGLLVRYSMPYESGMAIAHQVLYDVGTVNLVLTNPGVDLTAADAWTSQGAQTMGANQFMTYARADVPAGETVSFTLEGRPEQTAATGTGSGNSASSSLIRDNTTELLVGGGVFLIVLAVVAYAVQRWRQGQMDVAPIPAAVPDAAAAAPVSDRRDALLQAIADLDDAYEAGEIGESAYQEERQRLKEALVAIWNVQGGQ